MLNFKKGSIFSRSAGNEDDYEEYKQEDQGGVLAVWGSPGSGKTTVAARIAKHLAGKRKNTILLLCDMSAPMLPCICPPRDLENKGSLGSVLAAAHVSDSLIKNNLTTHKRLDYSGAYQPMAGDFEESLDYGDIYGRLDALLNLTNQSGYHVQYTEDGKMEFRVWDLSVDLQNASFASADSAGNRLIADCEIELEVPVSFGGRLLPPMRMTVKVSAGYTPRF